jgi:hypothetical protein
MPGLHLAGVKSITCSKKQVNLFLRQLRFILILLRVGLLNKDFSAVDE